MVVNDISRAVCLPSLRGYVVTVDSDHALPYAPVVKQTLPPRISEECSRHA